MEPKSLSDALKSGQSPLVADGGFSTSLYDKGFYLNRSFEELCLTHPESVREVTASFKRAGATLLSTNTFAATWPKLAEHGIEDKLEEIIRKSVEITSDVAGEDCYVLACMGPLGRVLEPLGPTSKEEAFKWFTDTAKIFESLEIDGYSLKGFHDLNELKCAIEAIRSVSKKPVMAHLGIQDNQKTNYGQALTEYVKAMNDLKVDVIGLAGEVGPSGMLTALETIRPLTNIPIALLPNAGFPRFVNDQYIYLCNPDYIGKYAKRYIQGGAFIVGGHSGVGETHIRAIANSLRMTKALNERVSHMPEVLLPLTDEPRQICPTKDRSRLGQKLSSGQKVVSVELLPPLGVDTMKFFDLCRQLTDGGIEFVNIPDGARAVARISSTQMASYIRQNLSLEPIPHFTARDRNLIGIQADLLGAHLNGVRNVLLVTGDPPKLGNNPGATGVYDVDAIGMTHILSRMNQGLDLGGSSFGQPTEFLIGVAVNPTAANLDLEVRRYRFKIEAGADFAITQPIYDIEAYEKFFELVGEPQIPVIMGVWPLVSLRNAEFLRNEVPGVSVPDWVIHEMEKAGDQKDEAVKRGLEIAINTMRKASSIAAGFQVSAPFNRVKVALDAIHGSN